MTRNWGRENPGCTSPGDRGPSDPRDVPWDQNFWLKNFLISSSNDVILCVLSICYTKNAQNREKLPIFCHFQLFSLFHRNYAQIGSFSWFWAFFAKQIDKTHKITSFEDDMRNFLSQKFWSHGTSLGSLGPLSQGAVHPGFSRPQFLVIWGPYNYPGIVACREHTENLKLTSIIMWSCVWYWEDDFENIIPPLLEHFTLYVLGIQLL